MSGMAPVAFVYDRCASRSYRQLEMRMIGCDGYADRMGWALAGRWIDLGENALTAQRPKLGALLDAMREESARREVLCLVHNWGRLSGGDADRLALQTRIVEAGGWSETTFGEWTGVAACWWGGGRDEKSAPCRGLFDVSGRAGIRAGRGHCARWQMTSSPRAGDRVWCLVCPDEVPPADITRVVIPATGRRRQPYVGRVHQRCAQRLNLAPAPAG